MGKTYTEEFKEMVVKDRLQNGLSVKETSEKYGVAQGSVCFWTDQYGFMEKEKTRTWEQHSEEEKGKVIQEYLCGRDKKSIIMKHNISSRTLDRWISEHWKQQEESRNKRLKEDKTGVFCNQERKSKNGLRLRTVYPTSASAYVTWAK